MRTIKKNQGLIIGIIAGIVVVAAILTKVALMLKKFKKNSDFFFWMDQDELDFTGEEFEDTTISAAFSSITVDLADAKPSTNPMNLCLKGFSSNLDVIVPKGWNVQVQGENKHSTIENVTSLDKDNFELPLLFVNYRLNKSIMNVYYAYQMDQFEDSLIEEVNGFDEIVVDEVVLDGAEAVI